MASSAPITDIEELPLIEEQVDTGLQPMLENYRPTYPLHADKKDELAGRFTLLASSPLPELSHDYAQAFRAADSQNSARDMYAMVLDNTLPYRTQAVTALNHFNNPHAVSPLASGTVQCSHLGESRMVLFFEKPTGPRLADHLKTQGRLHEHRVIDHVLGPAARALLAMRERGVSHGHIQPGAFYMGDETVLGECCSAPCGALSHYLYEPPERAGADPLGRGEANEKTDVYALGVLAFELIYGLERFRAMSREEFTRLTLELGTYHVFAGNRDFSDMYQDFFRGALCDTPGERWTLDQLAQWLGGKRFNMIAPSVSKEASRAFVFMEENYFSRRLIAHMFRKNWRETAKEIKSLRLDRWCEMSLHRPEMAERVERALRIAGGASTERHVNDMMTRIVSILDPIGPIRSMSVAVRPDGIGTLLAAQIGNETSSELNQLLTIIETDVANYWSELADFNKVHDPQLLWRLQRVRTHLKSRAFGFGIERALYDLNPSLPCQSDLLRQYHVNTANEALKALDALARNLAPDTSFIDRHLAAFVASKIDMGKEIRLHDLSTIPALADNPELVVLKILARAQQKNERLQLVGLATWAAMRIEKMLDEIHNRSTRRQLKLQLKKLAATGALNDVLSAVVNREIALRDHEGFARAIALHQINHAKIERFQNPRLIQRHANELGGRLASMIATTILTITTCFVLVDILGV